MDSNLRVVNNLLVHEAAVKLKNVVHQTPLNYNRNLSRRYDARIYLKREDLQVVRSYKLRGAFNLMVSLPAGELNKGVVCASAGNHAQGVAYSCRKLNTKGIIFMPVPTPNQKVTQTKMFGDGFIEVKLAGDNYDECCHAAQAFARKNQMSFIHPFDDKRIIEGQGTVAMEILADQTQIDYLFLPVGGGGLAAGAGSYFKTFSPATKIVGVEPEGAPSLTKALKAGRPVELESIDRFVDGAAVKKVGDLTFSICREVLDDVVLVAEGRVCTAILKLYNEDAIVAEPAGALAIAALESYREEIKGKTVVCIVSGGNNDIDRMQEIKERSLLHEGLKHYLLISFAQRPGALKEFVNLVLGPDDDITRFEYIQKHNKERGPALVGIECRAREDYGKLVANLQAYHFNYTEINKDNDLFGYLV